MFHNDKFLIFHSEKNFDLKQSVNNYKTKITLRIMRDLNVNNYVVTINSVRVMSKIFG